MPSTAVCPSVFPINNSQLLPPSISCSDTVVAGDTPLASLPAKTAADSLGTVLLVDKNYLLRYNHKIISAGTM